MKRFRLWCPILALGILCAVAAAPAGAGSGFWLVTADEAAKVRAKDGGVEQLAAAHAGPGPEILVKNPRALEKVYAPVDILVSFEPGQSGQVPDMASFKATLIGFIDIDLTDRVREYIQGNRLDVKEANLPVGSHRIRIAIRDVQGNPNERDLDVTIVTRE